MTQQGPLTVEEGRAMQARGRRYAIVEKVGLAMSGFAIVMFATSLIELRRIEDSVLAGAERSVPYFAYSAILLFVGGVVVFRIARHVVADISRALEAEQRRRDADDPVLRESADESPRAPSAATPPLEGR